ncbi:KAT8 regulatory NSL complex subunit 1 isoform X2 [Conger conger]|uniref:KAT8 regulatory NSL complex subunit 1 isoform X2 n=1 Tax=Conger conger TaxID=82655 RepID=UPI002A5AB6AE|nr:KAT8 regulatory NSL complex subunit 1 isoform X2 [Conger conger]
MYYYFNWPKMSGNAAGVGGGAAGILHRTLGSGGGGCGELVNGDGTCAAAATATTTTLAQCSERETSVAEAQAYNNRNNTSYIDADVKGENNDGHDVNNMDNADENRGCADSGEYVLGCLGAVNGQDVHLKEAGSINIDHKPSGSQHGGGHSSFMAAASRKTVSRQQRGNTGTSKNTNGESVSAENEGSSLTATAENGSRKPDPTVTKRRGCSMSRAPKRVCFAGTTTIAHCGISDSGARGPRLGYSPLRSTGGKSVLLLKNYNHTDTPQPGYRTPTTDGHHRGSSREYVPGCDRSDNSIRQASVCPPSAVTNSCVDNINSTDGRPPRTAKGRVRLYRVRSFVATTLGYNNRGNGGVALNGVTDGTSGGSTVNPVLPQARPLGGHKGLPDGQEGQSGSGAQVCGLASSRAIGRKGLERQTNSIVQNNSIQTPKEQTVEQNGVELTQNNASKGATRVCGVPAEGTALGAERVPVETLSAEELEAGASQAQHRQGQLEERTERLWRRLQVVQVKQMERHVVQQLQGLAGAMDQRREGGRARLQQASRPPNMPSSGELSRLARSCSEALRTAEGALDSDHTASSSGGESEGEERDGDSIPARKNSIQNSTEWQWAKCRAGLGSRWVWLQAQVSELEYRIRALTELYTHLRQGKGRGVLQPTSSLPLPVTPLRASRPPRPANSSLCSTSELSQNALRKKPAEETPHPPPEPPGSPSSAARVRPLLRQRRRKLIRLGASAPLAAKAVSVQCWCTPPAVCVLCADSPPRCPAQKGAAPWVQWAQLDLCLHPVLSFPPDVPLALRCGVPPRAGPRCHKPARPAGMPPPPSWLARRGQGSQKPGRLKRRPACTPLPHGHLVPTHDRSAERSQRGLVNLAFLSHRTCPSDLPLRPATPPTPDTPTQPTRRRRGESSFDIDNLVMPLGLAGLGGGARVQKLQYKEILTPSWRQLESPSATPAGQEAPSPDPPEEEQRATAVQEKEQEEEEVEDLSDAAFLCRHTQCERRERSRWGSWAQRRRRGRSSYRGDGKLGPRTPEQPPSPEPRPCLPSDCGSWPPSPQETPGTPGPAEEPSSFALEEEQLAALPWERRSFPLSEAELQWLQEEEEEEPPEDPSSTSARSQSTDSGISVGSLELSPIGLLPPPPVRQGQDLTPKPLGTLAVAFRPETQDSPSLQSPESPLHPLPLSLSPKPPAPLLQTRPAPS